LDLFKQILHNGENSDASFMLDDYALKLTFGIVLDKNNNTCVTEVFLFISG
jgi:hypothetical protein